MKGPAEMPYSTVEERIPALLLDTVLLEPDFPYGEDLLQFIWQEQLYERHALRTVDDRSVQVVHPGRIQHGAGPDLLDAQVRIDGQIWAGPIEVHLRSSDWSVHQHHRDPAYENVTLHVVHTFDGEAVTRKGRTLPVLELSGRISTDSLRAYLGLMRNRSWIPCEDNLGLVGAKVIQNWTDLLIRRRLSRKSDGVQEVFLQMGQDPAETFYHFLFRAFGLKENAEAFEALARSLPRKLLLKYRDDLTRIEALLFGQAGFLQFDLIDAYGRTLQQEYMLLAKAHDLRPIPLAMWRFGRVRPANFPTIRLALFAQLIRSLDGDLGRLLDRTGLEELRTMLSVEASVYWTTHHRFDQPSSPHSKRMGKLAIDHLIINAIIPYWYAEASWTGASDRGEHALGLLGSLPAESDRISKAWKSRGAQVDNAAHSQGLIELKTQYCDRRKCLTCSIGQHLLQRTRP